MKLRKGIIIALLLFLAIAITSLANVVSAASGSMELNIKRLRRDGYGYQISDGQKNVWKIYKTSNSQYETIYCLKGGPGFGSNDFATATPQATLYERYFDLKDPDSISSTYKNFLPDTNSDDYEALLWILDNIYVLPKDNASSQEKLDAEEQKQILLDAALDYAIETGNPDISSDGYEFELLTDDDIDATQQLAIWYYTNPSGDYHVNTFDFWLNALKGTDGSYTSLSSNTFTDGWDRQDACQALFYYLVETPQQPGFSYDYINSNSKASPVNIANTNVTITTKGNRIIVGPYRINETRNIEYSLKGTFLDGNNSEISDVILLDSRQQQVQNGTTLKDLVGQEFYISIPASTNTENITFNIDGSFFITTTEYWSVANPGSYDQPVVLIEKEKVSFEDSKTLTNKEPEDEFDLALRKFITTVKDASGQNVTLIESRIPQIASSELDRLENGNTTTVNKVHTKEPVLVEKGYKVTYTIRIYNEGDLAGYATEITDYLPEGLTFVTDSDINQKYGWTNPTGDGKTITTNYLQNTLLNGFDGNSLDYEDIQIECEVTADIKVDNQILKNIAEITEHKDENGNTDKIDTDRDSNPDNVDIENYGNTNQQDDDDFENLILPGKYFDLALRKFITVIDSATGEKTHQREPNVDVSPIVNGTDTTAIYNHDKTPIRVSNGDEVIYTIRVYNEGTLDGYVTEITDHLPSQLEFIEGDELNERYGWEVSPDGRTVTTDITSPNTTNATNRDSIYADRATDADKVLLKAFDGEKLDYIDVQIKCRVKDDTGSYQKITNIAEISDFTDSEGKPVEDIDSQKADEDNVEIPSDAELPTYKDPEIESGADYIPGEQDDDDFEKLVIVGDNFFDLSLRKFITGINDKAVTDREPQVDTTPLIEGKNTAIYNHKKTPIGVSEGDIVTYTIRVYNEGRQDGYVTEITDHLPPQLEYIVDDELNARYGWQISSDGRTVTTDITSPNTELSASRDAIYADRTTDTDKVLLKAFDDGEDLDYIDVQIRCKVKTGIDLYEKITNIVEITDDADSEGAEVEDIDSIKPVEVPDDEQLPEYKDPEIESGVEYIPGQEDDDDFEKLVLQKFDLALRKFITGVANNETSEINEINNRVPVFEITEDGKYEYVHPKDPVEVANSNIVIYTLRIFNEGNVAGYASEIKDDLPEGLEFLPEHEINTTYRWVMYKEDGTQTTNVSEASYIKTDYLSKEQEQNAGDNLLDAFNPETMTMPDYKDVQIAFKVTEANTSDRIIINTAEITDDSDEYGNPIEDIDSTPDNNVDGEDDIDIEKIKVLYFDLSLKKWVTESIVTYNGQTTVTQTGNTENDDPETPAKVEIRGSRISKTTVKFKFKIKVTNEGEIAGYVKELIDYVPEGLEFHAKDNPLWREEDGKILTDQLKDTLLQPGESATVEIILTWINSTDNLGEKVNWAEIYEDDNEYDSPDIDSTPGNNEHGEDDIDEAPVILAVVTGSVPTYITLILTSVSMLAGGIFLIKKFVI